MTQKKRDALILEHVGMVEGYAKKFARSHHLIGIQDELISEAFLGLLAATKNFDAAKHVPFRYYMWHRIYGAMLEYMRSQDPLSRKWRMEVREGVRVNPVYIEFKPNMSAHTITPEFMSIVKQRDRAAYQAMDSLPDSRMRGIIRMYFFEFLTYREIARVIGIHESRVHQILKECMPRMKSALANMGIDGGIL